MGKKKSSKAVLLKPDNMTIYEAMEIHTMFLDALKNSKKVKVDLSEVSEIDSSGLQLLIALKDDAKQQGKKVKFIAPNEDILALFDLFGIKNFFSKSLV